MKDNVLRKEFNKKDVTRLRNLVNGKSSNKTGQGVGYTKTEEFHQEGDIWEENGRTWTIRDGIKENITKLDKFKKTTVPLFCPSCSQVMNKQLDSHYYKTHNKCLDCTVKFETTLKQEGTWETHVKEVHNKEIDKTIQEYKSFIQYKMDESNNSLITEAVRLKNGMGVLIKKKQNKPFKKV